MVFLCGRLLHARLHIKYLLWSYRIAIAIVANPIAGRGNGKRLLEEVRGRFSFVQPADVLTTEREGDEARLTAIALERGCSRLVIVGGDGTCANVANVVIASGRPCALTVVPAGTGNDFAKTLGTQHLRVAELAELTCYAAAQLVDVGKVDNRYFLNTCGFGFDASVLEASQRVRLLRGNAVYIYSALKQLFSYPGVDVSTDNAPRERMLMTVISNGRYLGGGFKIAPSASVKDGMLDVAHFRNCGVIERADLFARAMKGTHIDRPSLRAYKSRELVLEFAAPPAMEVDGELRRAKSNRVEIECIPRALSVIAAPGALES